MASLNIYNQNKGFTLIEILVVIGILTVIISFGMIVDFSSFTSNTFQGEEAKIVSILQKARSRAMANMCIGAGCTNGKKHGVCYDSANSKYKIFQGVASDPNPDKLDANSNITISGPLFPCSSSGIIFDQLTGNTTSTIVNLSYGAKSTVITINNEGTINW